MAMQEYYYPKVGGDYRWNILQKILLAIGRKAIDLLDKETQTIARFDPPLNETTEKPLIDAIFADPDTAGNATISVINNSYQIKDIYEWRQQIIDEVGFPVNIWFVKSAPEVDRPDVIVLEFGGKLLTNPEKKDVENAVENLTIGWV